MSATTFEIRRAPLLIAAALVAFTAPSDAHAQAVTTTNPAERVIYPAQGQSTDAQAIDERTCFDWSAQKTEWSPAEAYAELEDTHGDALRQYEASMGGAVRGAAKGALAGLAIGAIFGDAGQGAAVGAIAGGAGGGLRSRRGRQAAQAAFQEAASEFKENFTYWDRHWMACMEGRGYSVR